MIESQKRFLPAYTWFATSSLFCGAFWWAIDSQEKYKLPLIDSTFQSELAPHLLDVSIELLLIGTPLVVLINFVMIAIIQRTSKRQLKSSEYFVKHPSEQEIDNIVNFGKRLVGENHIDTETLKRRFSINPKIISCLYDSKSGNNLIGYFIIYPLTTAALANISKGKVLNGKGITDKDICKRFENAAALYIGMVGGVGVHAEGYVVNELLNTLRFHIQNEKIKAIFTRGATADGKRAVDIFGFQRLAHPSEISMLTNSPDLFTHPRILRHLKDIR
ncbi:MAG: hypothetical protein WC742_03540 [Gallionellaceae bacterium]|jgi:hypothetical protein